MYPRNSASPERIAIGAVVQIADGAVQTSGVAVKVIPQGGVEASGGGTIAYSADGIVLYTPTQAETNYTSFVLVASKSGCFPVEKTIVTSAESTAGTVTANVTKFGGTAGTFADGRPEVNTTHWGGTAVGSVTINCNMTQISGDNTAADNAESFFDGTGYAGTNNVIPTVTTVSNRVTANTDQWNGVTVTGMPMPTYTQPTGFLAATFPTDPADQSAVEAAITAAIATLPTAAENADAVWDEPFADHTGSTTYGGRIVRATNSNVTVQITGSNHIAADVHAFQTDVIDATAIASSAVTKIQTGLATDTELAKVPKQGETRRYTQVAADSGNKTADVSIGAAL